jgi:iron complex outermembrane receptor protein
MPALCAVSARSHANAEDLTGLELETLMQMDVEVTTATRSAQSVYTVAAPIFVITAQDIRHSGASSVPEAIRLAPGVVVGQIDPGKWFVGMRGFAWQYANKALILLDGRGVYSPLNSSVYWNVLDIPIEDIDRIEVIRGPGDARWGSHAMNGIINIITSRAADTRGTALSALLDSNGGSTFTARHGGALAENADYRAYAKYLDHGDFATAIGHHRLGDRAALRTGVRLDAVSRSVDRFTFIGDLQMGRDTSSLGGQTFTPLRYDTNEWSALGRWERGAPGRLNQHLQLSFDRLNQELYEERDTFDLAYQAQLPERHAQTFTFGATYKRSVDALSAAIAIEPARMKQQTYGFFIHDSIALGTRSRVLLGSQFEHNRFTGWEVQPNLQFIYMRTDRQSYWASVARAVRTPLRTEDGFALEIPIFPGGVVRALGNRDLHAEDVLAWQAGVRMGILEDLFLDIAAFYNEYQDLIIQQAGAPFFEPAPPPGRTIFPAVFVNSAAGHTKGIEVVLRAQPVRHWSLAWSGSLYSQTRWSDPLGYGAVTAVEHQFQLHSSMGLNPQLRWNADLYYVGALSVGGVPAYYKFDTQLAWTPGSGFELALGVRNAFEREHQEAGANSVDAATVVPRMGYLRVLRHF